MPYQTDALLGATILVVEDQYLLAGAIAASIESAGGNVLGPYATRREALDCLDNCAPQPAAAALNIELEDGDSFPIADELASRGVPFVFASGNADLIPDRFAEALRVGKPYNPAQVVEVIAGLLSRA